MYCLPQNILKVLVDDAGSQVICRGLRGVEKESLRVDRAHGALSQTPHPVALGSALTHPFITTDFAESLLEFVSPALTENAAVMKFMTDVHKFTYDNMPGEALWPCSMPCGFSDSMQVPLARYGSSNVGQMKTVYRRGLGLRYGRKMQTIAGVHFNYSLPTAIWPVLRKLVDAQESPQAFQSACYFALLRNFRRLSWLVLYLFGASPAVCKSFFQGASDNLEEFDARTVAGPFATSLRMSDIGYSNHAQASLNISVNSLDEYVAGLLRAIATPHAPYEKIGLYDGTKRLQLSTNILQIANEYYSVVRPKRVTRSGEKPTMALRDRGVEYVEIRSLDIDPYSPIGINQQQLDFMECLLIHCALTDSPAIGPIEQVNIASNDNLVATRGREAGIELKRAGKNINLQDWAEIICERLTNIAAHLDTQTDDHRYREAVAKQLLLVADSSDTPSARMLQAMRESGTSYHDFGIERTWDFADYFQQQVSLPDDTRASFEEISRQSISKTRDVEAADTLTFEEYLEQYFAQTSVAE